jgi:hypothetical protein
MGPGPGYQALARDEGRVLAGCGKMGCAEGRSPSPGVWGCPPDTISSPFLARKGVRGTVERVFQHPVREGVRLFRVRGALHFEPERAGSDGTDGGGTSDGGDQQPYGRGRVSDNRPDWQRHFVRICRAGDQDDKDTPSRLLKNPKKVCFKRLAKYENPADIALNPPLSAAC